MNETGYSSPLSFLDKEWEALEPKEMALMVSYRRQLRKGDTVSRNIILAVNAIHEKYPDFHIGCMPKDHRASYSGNMMDSFKPKDPA